MFGNAKFRFLLAPIVVVLLVVASPARVVAGSQNDYIKGVSKNFLIADVYFDDGSVLHDAKFTPKDSLESSIKVKSNNDTYRKNTLIVYINLTTINKIVQVSKQDIKLV